MDARFPERPSWTSTTARTGEGQALKKVPQEAGQAHPLSIFGRPAEQGAPNGTILKEGKM